MRLFSWAPKGWFDRPLAACFAIFFFHEHLRGLDTIEVGYRRMRCKVGGIPWNTSGYSVGSRCDKVEIRWDSVGYRKTVVNRLAYTQSLTATVPSICQKKLRSSHHPVCLIATLNGALPYTGSHPPNQGCDRDVTFRDYFFRKLKCHSRKWLSYTSKYSLSFVLCCSTSR